MLSFSEGNEIETFQKYRTRSIFYSYTCTCMCITYEGNILLGYSQDCINCYGIKLLNEKGRVKDTFKFIYRSRVSNCSK